MKKRIIQLIVISISDYYRRLSFIEIVIRREDSIPFLFLPFYTYISYKLSFKLIFN